MNNLKVGSQGQEVRELQQFLKSIGLYSGSIDGIFGNQTDRAVRQFQSAQRLQADGVVGPLTRTKMETYSVKQDFQNDPNVQNAIKNDPIAARTMEALSNSGDINEDVLYSFATNFAGNPYSQDEFDSYFDEFYEQSKKYYDEMARYDTGQTESFLKNNLGNYERSNEQALSDFIDTKRAHDTSSANRGILFSSARSEELKRVEDAYKRDAESRAENFGYNTSNTLMNYQRKYGDKAVKNLSDYSRISTPTFDAFTPGGSTGTGGIQNLYNPKNYNFGKGTVEAEMVANATAGASSALANQANRNSLYGYLNRF